MFKPPRTLLPAVAASAATILISGLFVSPANAAENAAGAKKFDFDRLAYTQFIRAGAIESFADIPRRLPQDGGYSRLILDKDVSDVTPVCQSDGAGFYLSDEVEEGILKGGAAPVAEGQSQTDANPYKNPTQSKQVRPATGATDTSATDQEPSFPATGNGPMFTSTCNEDLTSGGAIGDVINASGVRVAGSTITAAVDQATGIYTATARAYVVGLEGAFDSLSSLFQISYTPGSLDEGSEPAITYRMSFFNSDAGNSAFASDGFTLGGTQVPAGELVNQFNDQAAQFAGMAQTFGPAGLRLLAPEVYPDQDTGRTTITAPAAVGNVGFASQAGSVGQNFGLRLASITWTGDSVYIP